VLKKLFNATRYFTSVMLYFYGVFETIYSNPLSYARLKNGTYYGNAPGGRAVGRAGGFNITWHKCSPL
jgi:hypothetical protein